MAVLGFGSRDTAASGGNYIAFFLFFIFLFLFFSAGFKRTAAGGVPVVVGGCKSDWDLHSGFVTRD